MKLIIGLGNPGLQYKKTWHNLGFLALDELANDFDFEKFKLNKKFNSETAMGKIGKTKIILAKPQTYMNNSGLAVAAILKYYKIDTADLIVIHDDIDLPLSKLRIAIDSSAGGHNGVKSIIDILKTKNFARIKIGVKTDKINKLGATAYVLEKIDSKNLKQVKIETKKAAMAAKDIIENSLTLAMNLYN